MLETDLFFVKAETRDAILLSSSTTKWLSDKESACLPMQETQVRSLGWEDLLEKGMATHSSILA